MRVVYLDVLFALNFAMDYCILRCVSALSGRPAAVWRLSLAAGLGALYAGGCIVIPVLSALPVRMAAGAVMAGTAFSIRQVRLLVRQTLLLLLVAFVFGGAVTALEQMSGTRLMQGGVLVAQVSRRVLCAAGIWLELFCFSQSGEKQSAARRTRFHLLRGKTSTDFFVGGQRKHAV